MSKITEKTWIPLGLAIVVIGGAAAWLATLSNTQSAQALILNENTRQIIELQKKYFQDVSDIKTDIAVIKVEVKKLNYEP